MDNTYYDSELTSEEIDRALKAISDVVLPTNNGKVLCITNGVIDAKSASTWGGGGYPEPTGTIQITQNGTVDVKDYASAEVNVSGGSSAVVQPLSVTQNGTYNPPSGVDGFSPVTVNVSGGGGDKKGFEVYAADGGGSQRVNRGYFDNNYFACFFDDNMSQSYTLNGSVATFSTIATGKQQVLATTRSVVNSSVTPTNALLQKEGSVFEVLHYDTGSYVSIVGGWVGYPSGGVIYESAAVGTSNSVTLNSAHKTLLIFIGASSNTSGITTVDVNGNTYTIENIGYNYGAYGMYAAIEINGNSDTNITVTFSASCWSYVSVIGIDS